MLATQSFFRNIVSSIDSAGIPGDGYYTIDANTVLLIRSDEATQNYATFADISGNSHTVTRYGAVHKNHDGTYPAKIGTVSSMWFGATDSLQISDHADWDWGTDDFTIDFWQRANRGGSTADENWISRRDDGQDPVWQFNIKDTDEIRLVLPNQAATQTTYERTYTVGTGTWKHMAITRASGSTRIFVDGVQQGATITTVHNFSSSYNGSSIIAGTHIQIARRMISNNWGGYFEGQMEEIRISDKARWTTNFDTVDTM